MVFKELLAGYKGDFENTQIAGITSDSRKVKKGYVFVCINGPLADGHSFALDAVKAGAEIVVCEKDLSLENQVIVPDTHEAFAYMCAKWFDFPAKKLKLIGVTGTNGKTSVTYMIKKILENAGHKVGLIGTIQNLIGDRVIETINTTPGIYDLNRLFSEMAKDGCDYLVMEVSSHALHQKRVCGFEFDFAVFTNLTQDHLDYHKTMDEYLKAKKMLFKMCKTAIINKDSEYFEQLTSGLDCEIITYSAESGANYCAKNINLNPASVQYQLFGGGLLNRVNVNIGGKFTVYNSLAAAVCAIKAGIDAETVIDALNQIEGVKGRAEVVPVNKDYTLIIDYAHTPDGLKNILMTFNECKKNRLIVLFGCGGDRDKSKRPQMGSIAVHFADYVIITSDNPRSENPTAIINDILEGTKGSNKPVMVIENRREAMEFAVSIATAGDIIVFAGKGHETYQILNDGKIHFDEREIINEILKDKG